MAPVSMALLSSSRALRRATLEWWKPGRKGGSESAKRGPEFFAAIGAKGGFATKANQAPDFFSQIGTKGGNTVKRERGTEFYAAIGSVGGSSPRKRRPSSKGA